MDDLWKWLHANHFSKIFLITKTRKLESTKFKFKLLIVKSQKFIWRISIMSRDFSVVGKRLPRVDPRSKATGEAIYTIDMQLPKMLCGKILRSPHAHARILNIDTSRAERLPGVKGIITGHDLKPEKKSHHCYGAFIPDEYPLAIDRVRFIGDEVAAVAALDKDTACQALDLIRVDYEPLAAVFDPEAALGDGAPQVHDHVQNNKSWRLYQDLGDVEHGFEAADHIQEDRFVTGFQCHSPLEPHATLAQFGSDGKLTVWSSTQRPFLCPGTLPRQWIYRKAAFA